MLNSVGVEGDEEDDDPITVADRRPGFRCRHQRVDVVRPRHKREESLVQRHTQLGSKTEDLPNDVVDHGLTCPCLQAVTRASCTLLTGVLTLGRRVMSGLPSVAVTHAQSAAPPMKAISSTRSAPPEKGRSQLWPALSLSNSHTIASANKAIKLVLNRARHKRAVLVPFKTSFLCLRASNRSNESKLTVRLLERCITLAR